MRTNQVHLLLSCNATPETEKMVDGYIEFFYIDQAVEKAQIEIINFQIS